MSSATREDVHALTAKHAQLFPGRQSDDWLCDTLIFDFATYMSGTVLTKVDDSKPIWALIVLDHWLSRLVS